jgi:hypothetical protein
MQQGRRRVGRAAHRSRKIMTGMMVRRRRRRCRDRTQIVEAEASAQSPKAAAAPPSSRCCCRCTRRCCCCCGRTGRRCELHRECLCVLPRRRVRGRACMRMRHSVVRVVWLLKPHRQDDRSAMQTNHTDRVRADSLIHPAPSFLSLLCSSVKSPIRFVAAHAAKRRVRVRRVASELESGKRARIRHRHPPSSPPPFSFALPALLPWLAWPLAFAPGAGAEKAPQRGRPARLEEAKAGQRAGERRAAEGAAGVGKSPVQPPPRRCPSGPKRADCGEISCGIIEQARATENAFVRISEARESVDEMSRRASDDDCGTACAQV